MRGPSRRLLLSALLVVAALPSTRVHASSSDEATVSVSVDTCVPIDRAALQRILAVELGTSTIQQDAALAAQAPTRVHIGCAEHEILLRLEDGVTSKVMTRALPAQSFTDPSSTRLLALAVAEFVVASWIELQVQPEPTVRPLQVAPAPTASSLREVSAKVEALPSRKEPEHTTVSLGASFQLYASQGWPATVKDGSFTAPFSAPSAGPPPWDLYEFTPATAFGVATAEPHGAMRWRF